MNGDQMPPSTRKLAESPKPAEADAPDPDLSREFAEHQASGGATLNEWAFMRTAGLLLTQHRHVTAVEGWVKTLDGQTCLVEVLRSPGQTVPKTRVLGRVYTNAETED